MKYLLIDEDGQVYKSDNVTEDDFTNCDDGILEIIRLSDLKSYCRGEWNDLRIYGY